MISKAEFMHGYYEARFKIPAGKGWHTSFYTEHYNGKDTGITRGREEIDICGQNSPSGRPWGNNYTLHDWGSKSTPHGVEVPPPKLPAGHVRPHNQPGGDLHDFHTWGMEFSPAVVNFYFDGELRGSVDGTLFKHTPMSIFLTSISVVPPDDSKLPSEAQFDYVRYFTKPQP